MNYIAGEAVNLRCELETADVATTTLTLVSLKDPDGTELANSETFAFGTGDEANIATRVWQTSSSSVLGRYKFLIKALNGTRENFGEGQFMLKARP